MNSLYYSCTFSKNGKLNQRFKVVTYLKLVKHIHNPEFKQKKVNSEKEGFLYLCLPPILLLKAMPLSEFLLHLLRNDLGIKSI